MNVIFYTCLEYAAYFIVMIACCTVAIVFSKRLFAWFIFLPGALIQLLSLVGMRKQLISNYTYYLSSYSSNYYNTEAVSTAMRPYWIIYVFLFVATALTLIIVYRRNWTIYRSGRRDKYAVVCEKCGNEFNKNEARCPKCGNKNMYG